MKKQPEKTQKTRQHIISTFWELATKEGIDHVTISSLMKKTGLNRGTFYVYFKDMPDLLEEAEKDIIHDLQNKLSEAIADSRFTDFDRVSGRLVDIFTLYDDKFFLLIGKSGDSHFRSIVHNEANHKFAEMFQELNDRKEQEFIVSYLTSAFLGVLTYWYETGKKISVVELGSIIHTMATGGIHAMTSPRHT